MEDLNDEIRLKDVILKLIYFKDILFAKSILICSIALVFGVFGVVFSFLKPPTYKADLTFVIDESQEPNALGAMAGLASQFGFNIGGSSNGTFSQSNIEELILSKRVVQAAILEEGDINGKNDLLINHYLEFKNFHQSWLADGKEIINFSIKRENFSFEHDSILMIVYDVLTNNNISTNVGDESSIVSISCKSENEVFSKLLVESLAKNLESYYTKFQTAKTESTLQLLSYRADSVLTELKNAEYKYASHKDSNFGVQRAKGLLEEIRLKRDVEILNIMYGEIIKNLELSKFTLLNNKPLLNIIDSPSLPLEEKKLSKKLSLILFSIIGGFFAVLYIIIRQLIRDEMA
ncbi:MAG: Wzz/FepE/Etk N-terminal domain-containing protein [Flavobacteriales bacterium]